MLAEVARRPAFAVTFLPDGAGCWHLYYGHRAIAAFANRNEAACFARELALQGLAVTILFEDRAAESYS